ncbi:GNAT family N-acetyltransferase [Allorhizocola rhizosphaerae]|uniref:GNAT family N-acetyltransferase n=1 Tax=Allorhizocola rhizosphaerae TaxID=1872709 RepID=UPI000E3D6A63|nr:GNAT family N-acetyltransferase [Allorhizocola rhizosphaerae]
MTLWRVRATVDDRPGFLAVLTASLALRSINILAVQVHTTEAGAVDDFLLDAPDNLDEADLLAAIERGRGRNAWVARTDAHGLVDAPAQIAGLAARLVADPEALGQTLSAMLGGCLVQHERSDSVTGHGATNMRVADPAGGTIVLTRLAPVFTPAEFARAQALVEVARAAMTCRAANATLLLPGGEELSLRPAGESDLPAVRRLHAASGGPSDARLRRLLSPARGVALLAENQHGEVVAMAHLIGEGELAEAALLVQDSMRRKGLGTALLRRLLGLAGPLGLRAVELHMRADNHAMVRLIRRVRPQATFDHDGGHTSATLPVRDLATTPI